MSPPLTLIEAGRIMTNYLTALGVVMGDNVRDQTDICVTRDGMFLIRPASHKPEDPAIAHTPDAVRQMTEALYDKPIKMNHTGEPAPTPPSVPEP